MATLLQPPVEPLPERLEPHKARFKKRGSSLGLASTATSQLIQQIEAGFPFEALLRLESNTGLDMTTLSNLIGIPERTLARRKVAGKLSPEESERLLRIASVFEKAVDLFHGDIESAVRWLASPKKALAYQQPLNYARTELGAREVENLIGRIGHGVFS